MALYRRHLMEAANNQNVDIYTVEQVMENPSVGAEIEKRVCLPTVQLLLMFIRHLRAIDCWPGSVVVEDTK